jgi:DNA-binding YbaB/EbfC family protein
LGQEIAVFDGGGAGGFDMSNLLAQAQAMQNQLMEAQADLESQEIEGSAGGGLVTALVSGTGELLSLDIKKEAVDPDDTETLADLIVAAVRDASENAKQAAAAAMGPLAGGLGGAFGGEGGFPGGEGGFPGFGGGQSAPAGFSLPGTPPAVESGDDERDDPTTESRPGTDNGPGSNQPGSDNHLGNNPTGSDKPGSGSRGSVGFVNPGSAAGDSGQNPG